MEPFGDSMCLAENDNYLAVWGFGGASQPVDVSLHDRAETYQVPIGRDVDAAITRFDVVTSSIGQTARGDYLDIGGSTGGGSRRIIDGWKPPDWRQFLEKAQ